MEGMMDYLIAEHQKDMRYRGEGTCASCGNEVPLSVMSRGKEGTLICYDCLYRLAQFGPWWVSYLDPKDMVALLAELDKIANRYRDRADLEGVT